MLERWIADRPFREACPPGQSDLDVARGTHAREILQDHWRNWIVESDWAWLAKTGINAVRIPVSPMAFSEPPPAPDWQFCLHFSGRFHPFLLPLRLTVSHWMPNPAMFSSFVRDANPSRFSRALACP